MSLIPTLAGVSSSTIQTSRLKMHYLEAGKKGAAPVVLVHGNASSSTFFESMMLALADHFHVIAPDMRGYGETEYLPTDATRGARDGSDDLAALMDALEIHRPAHFLGWSLGGGWVMQLLLDHPEKVKSLILEAPVSPYGFGGTVGLDGKPAFSDFAASGAGGVSPEFPERMKAQDRSADAMLSPRNVMNNFYFKPPFKSDREEELLSGLLQMRVDPGHYPGDAVSSPNWPTVAPGVQGVLNAFSPKYFNTSGMIALEKKVPILWIRGADDQVVSNTSFWDVAFLGKVGAIPGWPGDDVLPPQPMVDQTRAVLDQYAANGGSYREVVLEGSGHSPHIEKEAAFVAAMREHLG